ncbi:MAG: hypothetical protein M3T56_00025 [Chloroflexota bacterium]|nr:hypothetical protein [Chloroflexota bacterium]
MRIAPGVHRIGEGIVNAYLLEESGEITIVDAGGPVTGTICRGSLPRWAARSRTCERSYSLTRTSITSASRSAFEASEACR